MCSRDDDPTQHDVPRVDVLENDIRELRGANPGELAQRLMDRGWDRRAPVVIDPAVLAEAYDLVMLLAPDPRPTEVRWRAIAGIYSDLLAAKATS